MRAAERTLNLFWIVFGLAVAALSPRYTLLDTAGPGGGFLPLLTGAIITLCGLLLLLSRGEENNERWPDSGVWFRMGLIVGGLGLIAILMPTLGFVLTVIPVMMILMQAVERQSWLTVLVVSIVATLAVYYLFTRLLGTTLPRGLLGF
jgi:hypothetical protein